MSAAAPIARLDFPDGRSFQVVLADLLKETTDGIVNAANGHLAHGGGVAAAIARAAGPELDADGKKLIARDGPVPTGSAVLTTAGRLPFRGVIHVVGPRMGQGDEKNQLIAALVMAFTLAEKQGWKSLSFPAVSSGSFAVPEELCARAYVAAVQLFWADVPDSRLRLLRLCLFPGPVADAMVREIGGPPAAL